LDGTAVGAQQASEAYWLLVAELGPDGVTAYPSLKDAFAALDRREVSSVAGDALVGAYLMRDRPGVRYVGTIGPAHLLGVAVAADNTKLADAMRTTLDTMAADGVLDAIRSAWVGSLPKLPLPSSDASDVAPSGVATP
jgi:ABC-type amino acid transport substrate-binding protein